MPHNNRVIRTPIWAPSRSAARQALESKANAPFHQAHVSRSAELLRMRYHIEIGDAVASLGKGQNGYYEVYATVLTLIPMEMPYVE